MGVRELYEQTLAERGFKSDPAQLRAVDALERCENEWADYKARREQRDHQADRPAADPARRLLYGGVGRGKSFLMDCFFKAVPLKRKTRLHFHEFMREVHRELQDLKGTADPLQELGRRIARRFRLICFDEFHVADVTDAMILHRLLEALFENRVEHRHHLELPARRALPERPAPRPHPAGDRAAEGQARGDQRRQRHRLPAAHAAAT